MLQQTTIQAVLPYYHKWLGLFPDIKNLSQAPLQKVLKAWQGLGYYQRAKNLHKASQVIMNEYEGRIPQTYDELIKLPGFGPYTTAAVLSFGFKKSYPVIDTNVRRITMRLMGIQDQVQPKMDKALLDFLASYFPQKRPGSFNQALMELGSLVCRPKNPSCLLCPINEFCRAFKEGIQEIIPLPKRRDYQKIEAVVALIRKNSKFLIQKRPPKGLLADLWEFPGGKRKPGETLEATLHREIKEELSSEIKKINFLIKVHHSYTKFQVSLSVYECELKNDPIFEEGKYRWVTIKSLRLYPVPSGSAKIIKFLEEREKLQKKR